MNNTLKNILIISILFLIACQKLPVNTIQDAEIDRLKHKKAETEERVKQAEAERERQASLVTEKQRKKSSKVFRDTLKDGSEGPEMVKVPAGSVISRRIFMPKVLVRAFAMGKYEVTVGEFKRFVQATGYKTDAERKGSCGVIRYRNGLRWTMQKGANWRNPSFFQNNSHPVTCVSLNDSMVYVKWLKKQTGKNYRLPTEAEWEHAARAGTNTKYWWGNNVGSNKANCKNNHCRDSFNYTAPVGSFKSNQFDIYDTVGNVIEWCSDVYSGAYPRGGLPSWRGYSRSWVDYALKVQAAEDLFGGRGGSWADHPRDVREMYMATLPYNGFNNYGIRLVREPSL